MKKIKLLPVAKTMVIQERVTSRFLSKYERARIIGTRALQISMNFPLTVDRGDLMDPIKIATKELESKTLQHLVLRRYLPNGNHEDWPLKDLVL